MRKIIFLLTLAAFFSLAGSARAVIEKTGLITQTASLGASSAARQNLKTQAQQTQITNLQQKAATEISRRVNFLTELSTKIDSIKKLSDTDKTALKTQIMQQSDGLTVLLSKINTDSDLTTLKTDVKSIINGYYIFAFFRVKISLLVAADRLTFASSNMDIIYNKLQTRVTEFKTNGKNVADEEVLLSDMRKKIDDANLQYQAAVTLLNQLEAQGYPQNKASLTTARSKIKLGATDLRAAFKDATKIRQMFVKPEDKLKPKTSSESASESN